MNTKNKFKKLLIYELKIQATNFIGIFFGLIFPIVMSYIVIKGGALKEVPTNMLKHIKTEIFLSFAMFIVIINLISFVALYAVDIEQNIPIRMRLFGFSDKLIITSKIVSMYLALFISLIIYFLFGFLIINIQMPTFIGALTYIILLFILQAILLILGYSIVSIFKKFSISYGISMILYFFISFYSGLMGISSENMPGFSIVEKILPFAYLKENAIKIWLGEPYYFATLIQSLIVFTTISIIIFLIGNKYKKTN